MQSNTQRTRVPRRGLGHSEVGGGPGCQAAIPAATPGGSPSRAPRPANQSLLLTTGCLAEQWSGKKGDTAPLGGKKSKKKSSRAKASGGSGSKQRKELGDPGPEEDEGIQQASPLTHSPPDEL